MWKGKRSEMGLEGEGGIRECKKEGGRYKRSEREGESERGVGNRIGQREEDGRGEEERVTGEGCGKRRR